jgi:hypothetical protein
MSDVALFENCIITASTDIVHISSLKNVILALFQEELSKGSLKTVGSLAINKGNRPL